MTKKLEIYIIRYTVWEYYAVTAQTRKEAMQKALEDPYFCDYKSKKIIRKE